MVPNWNGAHHLGECLAALRRQTFAAEMEVIVVDNGSCDGSLHLLGGEGSWVRCLRNATNVGFAAAMNQGIAATTAPFVASVNNDAVVAPDWTERLLAPMARSDDVGACASRLLSYDQPQVYDNAGHVVFRDGLTRGSGRLCRDAGQFDREEEVFCASGAAALYRRSMLDDVGGFDGRFFAYCEDADLGFRARLRGWRCLYVPEARAWHRYSASSGAYSAFKAFHVERNRLWLALKTLPWPQLRASPWHTARRYYWQAFGALAGRGAAGRLGREGSRLGLAVLLARAWAAALRGVPAMLADRRVVQRRRTVGAAEVDRWFRSFGIGAREIALME